MDSERDRNPGNVGRAYAIYYRGSETPPTVVGRLNAPSSVAMKNPCGGIPHEEISIADVP